MNDIHHSRRTHDLGHARRGAKGGHNDPQAQLDRLPIGHRDYKRVLGALLKLHNHAHAGKHKGVSFETMRVRQRFLMGFFAELRTRTKYANLDPRALATRHIEAMVALWLARGLSTATIHNYLSVLRTFGAWIGKPGLVRRPDFYVGTASPHAHRSQNASYDHGWSARDVYAADIVERVHAIDPLIALRLELCNQFALRPKESGHLRPHEAIIPRARANPRDAEPWPGVDDFLHVQHGTKGGRPRDVPITTPAQRELLERVKATVAPGQFVGDPSKTAVQNRRRFYHVMSRVGITKAQLGVVPHGLRHDRANDLFEATTGHPSPVRGGHAVPNEITARGRLKIARLLGHGRPRITAYYLGAVAHRRESQSRPTPAGPSLDPAAQQSEHGSADDAEGE